MNHDKTSPIRFRASSLALQKGARELCSARRLSRLLFQAWETCSGFRLKKFIVAEGSVVEHKDVEISQTDWKCRRSGTVNDEVLNWYKTCNAHRYSMYSISEDEKTIVREYVEKQRALNTFDAMHGLQNSYFGNYSLAYMKLTLSGVNDYIEKKLIKMH